MILKIYTKIKNKWCLSRIVYSDVYKEMNEVKTKTKENDKIENNNVEESADDKTDNDCVILSNPNAWKSVKE